MSVRVKVLKRCYVGNVGDEETVPIDEYERLSGAGYVALVAYETAARVTPEKRRRGRPKKT